MHRRRFLRTALAGTGAAILAAQVRPPLAWGSAEPEPWWSSGNFAPVRRERVSGRLPVTGRIPKALEGLYVRNGTNAHPGTAAPHWFIGDGMVHGVKLQDGDARWYRNAYVRTRQLERDTSLGGSGAPPGPEDGYANVSVISHAGKLLASGEVGLAWELSPADLSTVGPYDFDGRLKTSMTAHPKIDPETGMLHFFGYGFFPPYLTYHVADASGALVHSEEVAVPGPTMMHDFAITDRDVVFWDLPVVFDLDRLDSGIPYSWDVSYGARIGVMPLGGPASATKWVEIDPCYVFHGVNAFRDGDDVVVDVCRHESMFNPGLTDSGSLSLRRWTVNTAGTATRFAEDVIEDRSVGELPTRDPRMVGREHRYGYLLRSDGDGGAPRFKGVIKQDFRTGTQEIWKPAAAIHGGEFLFVPDDDGGSSAREDDGYLLSYVHDDRRDAADLVILDARDVAAGPIATVEMPARIPYGFHAAWVPAD